MSHAVVGAKGIKKPALSDKYAGKGKGKYNGEVPQS